MKIILEDESVYALILLLMAIPGHIIFVILIFAINIGFTTWNWLFLFLYLVIGITQVRLRILWNFFRTMGSLFAVKELLSLSDLTRIKKFSVVTVVN